MPNEFITPAEFDIEKMTIKAPENKTAPDGSSFWRMDIRYMKSGKEVDLRIQMPWVYCSKLSYKVSGKNKKTGWFVAIMDSTRKGVPEFKDVMDQIYEKCIAWTFKHRVKLGLGRTTKEDIMKVLKHPFFLKEEIEVDEEGNPIDPPPKENGEEEEERAPTMILKLFEYPTKKGGVFKSNFFDLDFKEVPWERLVSAQFLSRIIDCVWYIYVGGTSKMSIQNECIDGTVAEYSARTTRSMQADSIAEMNREDPEAAKRLREQMAEAMKAQAEEDFFGDGSSKESKDSKETKEPSAGEDKIPENE